MKKKVTFYYHDLHQKHLFKYVSKHLNKKKFDIFFTKNLNQKSDIGFYAESSNNIKKIKSNISFISLGGMDQGKLFWPNLWMKESWKNFDFGILPGTNWANMWKKSSWYDKSLPKKGMLLTGWPKTEYLKNIKFKKNKKKTILYAPCFETDNKGIEVVDAIKNLDVKLLIKHLPWNHKWQIVKFKDVRDNIKKMTHYAKLKLNNKVDVINSKENIMKYYNKADILITDESSVMYEALLFDLPTLSCEDWPIRTNNTNKPRAIHKDETVCNYVLKDNLREKILEMLEKNKLFKRKIKKRKKIHFSYINNSAKNLSIFLENYLEKKKIKFQIRPMYKKNYLKSRTMDILNYFSRTLLY